ncbi:MAG: glycosyltransferase [Patescibacteria group bacterium]
MLVVDDGSTDVTARVAKEHGADKVYRFEKNQGKAMAFFEATNYYLNTLE